VVLAGARLSAAAAPAGVSGEGRAAWSGFLKRENIVKPPMKF